MHNRRLTVLAALAVALSPALVSAVSASADPIPPVPDHVCVSPNPPKFICVYLTHGGAAPSNASDRGGSSGQSGTVVVDGQTLVP